tara:strand:- start:283 stop:441 length:159 start_codon:yes stop_codon:yes gene_type:complete
MSNDNFERVRDWPRVGTRIDSDTERKFQEKLKENGDKQSEVLRKAVRNYTKD